MSRALLQLEFSTTPPHCIRHNAGASRLVAYSTKGGFCRRRWLIRRRLSYDRGEAPYRLRKYYKLIAREVERDITARQVQLSASAQCQLHRIILIHCLFHVGHPFRLLIIRLSPELVNAQTPIAPTRIDDFIFTMVSRVYIE